MKKNILEPRKRLGFSRFLHECYGLNIQTAYAKVRRKSLKRWEKEGIRKLIFLYDPDYKGRIEDYYNSIQGKRVAFLLFMHRHGMCVKTASLRFRKWNFTELELVGYDTAYEEFKKK